MHRYKKNAQNSKEDILNYFFRVFLLSVFLLPIISSTASGAQGFSLGPGDFAEPNSNLKQWEEKEEFWRNVTLNIDDKGKLVGSIRKNMTITDEKYHYVNVVTYDGNFNGEYDAENGTFNGKFTIDREWHSVKKASDPIFHDTTVDGTGSFTGSFTGKSTNAKSVPTFSLVGTDSYKTHTVSQNGREEDDSRSIDWAENVKFQVQGTMSVPTDVEDLENQPGVDTGARFLHIQGEVKIFPDGQPDDISFANDKTKIEPGTHIFTGEESSVTLVFADQSTYKVPPNSEIVIKSFNSKDNLSLISGTIWANFKKIANGESIEVRTNQAVLGIKGTTFVLESKAGKTLLKMIEGTVSFKSIATGKTETVKTGETITASQKGLSEKTTFDTVEEEKKWQSFDEDTNKINSNDTNQNLIILAIAGLLIAGLVLAFFMKRKKYNS